MKKSKPIRRQLAKQRRLTEKEEIQMLKEWIEFGKPDPGLNPLSLPPLPEDSPVGKLDENTFSRYAGCQLFKQLPLSRNTKDGLRNSKFERMTDVQRASLPHSLCGRDILGAAQTGSLAFVIPTRVTVAHITEIELRWREKEVAKLGNKAEEANRRHCPLMDEGGYEKIVLFENLNPDEPVIEAHSFNEAIAKSLMDESLFVDKHPEKRLKSSFKIALGNILKFRKKNWQFDIIGGVIYFVLAFLMFPQCKLDYLLRHDSFSGHLRSFFATVLDALLYVLDYSYVSFLGAMLLLLAAIMFVPPKVSRKR